MEQAALQEILAELRAIRKALEHVGPGKPSESEQAITIEEATQRLGCSESQIFVLLKKGILVRAPRVGKHVEILTSSLQRAREIPHEAPPRRSRERKSRRASNGWKPIDPKNNSIPK